MWEQGGQWEESRVQYTGFGEKKGRAGEAKAERGCGPNWVVQHMSCQHATGTSFLIHTSAKPGHMLAFSQSMLWGPVSSCNSEQALHCRPVTAQVLKVQTEWLQACSPGQLLLPVAVLMIEEAIWVAHADSHKQAGPLWQACCHCPCQYGSPVMPNDCRLAYLQSIQNACGSMDHAWHARDRHRHTKCSYRSQLAQAARCMGCQQHNKPSWKSRVCTIHAMQMCSVACHGMMHFIMSWIHLPHQRQVIACYMCRALEGDQSLHTRADLGLSHGILPSAGPGSASTSLPDIY